jgi:hypothetical protein
MCVINGVGVCIYTRTYPHTPPPIPYTHTNLKYAVIMCTNWRNIVDKLDKQNETVGDIWFVVD